MLWLFDAYTQLFKSWKVKAYDEEGETYLLKLTAILRDNSDLQLRDYYFSDGSRKYTYHWMDAAGTLRRRWDNAPHWPDIATYPHHVHVPGKVIPEESTITDLEELLQYIQHWFSEEDI